MSKNSGSWTARDSNMGSNMSANILRSIVASTFNVKATNVVLSGEINPETSYQNSDTSGSLGSYEDNYQLFGFNPEEGFVELSEYIGDEHRSNYNHDREWSTPGTPLYDIPNIDRYIFLVVINTGHNRWQGSTDAEWDNTTLYKLPNFKEYWENIEEKDLNRWKEWLYG